MVCFTKILCSNKLKVVAIKTSCNEEKKKKKSFVVLQKNSWLYVCSIKIFVAILLQFFIYKNKFMKFILQ